MDKQIGRRPHRGHRDRAGAGRGRVRGPRHRLPARPRRVRPANGIVFVADEIQSGFGRTGRMFAIEHEGVEPDLVTMAKSLAGGLPLAAVTGRAEIMDAVHPGGLGGTFAGNPLACAAALAVLDQIDEEGLLDRAARLEGVILGRLRDLQDRFPLIGDVRDGARCAPSSWSTTGRRRSRPRPRPSRCRGVLKQGVVVLKCGTYDNVLRFLPPLTIDEGLLSEAFDVLEQALATAESEAVGDKVPASVLAGVRGRARGPQHQPVVWLLDVDQALEAVLDEQRHGRERHRRVAVLRALRQDRLDHATLPGQANVDVGVEAARSGVGLAQDLEWPFNRSRCCGTWAVLDYSWSRCSTALRCPLSEDSTS